MEIELVTKKAFLLHKSKLVLNSGLVREIVIWSVPKCLSYPESIKYRLALVDPVWKKTLLLFDNHKLKGHHYHDNEGTEHRYRFVSLEKLFEDFFKLEIIQERQHENNEN
jgi:hypothetical protein